jgi:hypothetical protein
MMQAFKNSRRLLFPRYSSCLQRTGGLTRQLFSSCDSTKIADIIVNNYHPKDTKLCLKTLKTLVSIRSKEAANSALLSVSFRSKNETKMFLTWIQSVVANVQEIPAFPMVRKLTSRKKKALNLSDSCRSYIIVRESLRTENDREIDFGDIEALILDIADNIPERLVLDVSAILRQYCFELQQSPELKAELSDELLKKLIDSSSIYFDVVFSLITALDIVDGKGRQFGMLRTKATKIQKQRINDTTSFSVNLLRLIENIEGWNEAKAAKLLLHNNNHNSVRPVISDEENDDISDDVESDHDHEEGKISRVKNLIQHQWGWSLHCLYVTVNNKDISPLDQWLLDEEARLLSADTDTESESESPSVESASVSALPSERDTSSTSLLLTPPPPHPLQRTSGEATTTFVSGDDRHSSSDFDEPYFFQDIKTAVAETRDQNSLEDIANDRDMAEKLR